MERNSKKYGKEVRTLRLGRSFEQRHRKDSLGQIQRGSNSSMWLKLTVLGGIS